MSTSITQLGNKLKYLTQLQKTQLPLFQLDYQSFIIDGFKRLFIDTARYSSFNTDMISFDQETDQTTIAYDLPIDEQEYVLLCAQLQFYQRAIAEVNAMVGYTTDAISITNADKPYANIKNTINDLQKRRRQLFYRMVRYTLG